MVAVVAFVGLGYLSNALAAAGCEQQTQRWMNDILATHPNNWPHRVASCEPARHTVPWIVSVEYCWAVSSTGGEGGSRSYFALFGLAIPIWNHVEIVS
jgi:hypothetical protein